MKTLNTPQELKTILEQNNLNTLLLDVRTPEEYKYGHINTAINFDISGTDIFAKIQSLDSSKTYIVYCETGSRSQLASILMNQRGLDVVNCQFGYISWDE